MEKNEIPHQINSIVKEIIEDYNNDRAIDNMDEVFHQPDRDVIIDCARKLMEVIFPGFYREKNYKIYNIDHMISLLLEDVLFHLSKQIYISFSNGKGPNTLDDNEREDLRDQSTIVTLEFLKKIPQIRAMLNEDLHATFEGDPAAFNFNEIIVAYPGLFAITIHRLAHELSNLKVPLIPRVLSEYAHSETGIDIHPEATIGHHFFIDHGTGIVIGQSCVIGDHVKLYQGVTLGALSTHGGQSLRNKRRHPTIEDNVTIYSNATILGGETIIGHDSVIGGNAFITKSIKPGTRVSVKTQELQMTDRKSKQNGDEWFYVI